MAKQQKVATLTPEVANEKLSQMLVYAFEVVDSAAFKASAISKDPEIEAVLEKQPMKIGGAFAKNARNRMIWLKRELSGVAPSEAKPEGEPGAIDFIVQAVNTFGSEKAKTDLAELVAKRNERLGKNRVAKERPKSHNVFQPVTETEEAPF
jgi:hypothetical protein